MELQTVRDLNLAKKRVLLRTDYNVSLLPNFKIGDDLRIKQTIPTIQHLLQQGCTVILMTHLGRPDGKKNARYSLKPVEKDLERLLGRPVKLVADYLESPVPETIKQLAPGSVVLLENLRFYPGEEANDPQFARKLADLGEVYVNDAFGACHREHASIVGIPKHLPSAAGLLLEKEVALITKAIARPQRPLVVIVGGAKAETKIPLIGSLMDRADAILIGGGLADTFLKAKAYDIGVSRVDPAMVKKAKQFLAESGRNGKAKLVLPADVIVGHLDRGKLFGVEAAQDIQDDMDSLDIGPKTLVAFGKLIAAAETIIWNGPMGFFERPEYATGTEFVYQAIAENRESFSLVGGGETLTALPKEEYLETIDHVSTGGGAMLEFIEKGTLPGIEALQKSS
jgi:3-phosphoglycerate kinase